MQHQKNNKPSSMQPLQNENKELNHRESPVEEAKQVNKLRMLLNAVKNLNSQQ